MKIKKCLKCCALIEVLNDCNCTDCGITCCGEAMQELNSNSVDASFEKHVPNYELKDNIMYVSVNHVMKEEHYIEWIMIEYKNEIRKFKFKPNESPVCESYYEKDAMIYAYCNKHGLWSKKVD